MSIPCKVIEDLLPLYLDGICSEETATIVQAHLQICPQCRKTLTQMQSSLEATPAVLDETKMVVAASAAWKKAKRKSFIQSAIAVLSVVILLLTIFVLPCTKWGMVTTVEIWHAQLDRYAAVQLVTPAQSICWRYRITSTPEADCVFFTHLDSAYKGFFYSANGQPVGFQGAAAEFEKHGDGWLWKEAEGDNWMYAEHIVGNWYWFEMHF